MQHRSTTIPTLVSTATATLLCLALLPAAATANGGVSATGERVETKPQKAKLKKNGEAVPPANAPKRIKRAIRAGNKIRRKPYKWGGGHGRWEDKGYDCSGAVSYVLRGAKMLKRPRASGGFMRWRKPGRGKWITVYAHGGHAFVVVAGLRFDTSGTGGKGPRWHKDKRSTGSFKARHFSKRF
jgi:cell wall-associated NlpC family hydrolase